MSFEYLKQKNFPLFDNLDLNNDFKLYTKKIMQSNLMTEYINNINKIPEIEISIFSREEIMNEIDSNTMWVLFPLDNIKGITERETYTIFLNSYFKENEDEKLVIEDSSKVITKTHEDANHILRLILTTNNINIEQTTPPNGNIYKNISYNKLTKNYRDAGDKWEVLLFGDKISKIYMMGSLMVLDIDNFNLGINDFTKKFKKMNKKYSLESINKELKKSQKNNDNKLLKNFTEFKISLNNKYWLEKDQSLFARTNSSEEDKEQYLTFGVCGTVHYD